MTEKRTPRSSPCEALAQDQQQIDVQAAVEAVVEVTVDAPGGASLAQLVAILERELGLQGRCSQDSVNQACKLLGVKKTGSLIERARKCHDIISSRPSTQNTQNTQAVVADSTPVDDSTPDVTSGADSIPDTVVAVDHELINSTWGAGKYEGGEEGYGANPWRFTADHKFVTTRDGCNGTWSVTDSVLRMQWAGAQQGNWAEFAVQGGTCKAMPCRGSSYAFMRSWEIRRTGKGTDAAAAVASVSASVASGASSGTETDSALTAPVSVSAAKALPQERGEGEKGKHEEENQGGEQEENQGGGQEGKQEQEQEQERSSASAPPIDPLLTELTTKYWNAGKPIEGGENYSQNPWWFRPDGTFQTSRDGCHGKWTLAHGLLRMDWSEGRGWAEFAVQAPAADPRFKPSRSSYAFMQTWGIKESAGHPVYEWTAPFPKVSAQDLTGCFVCCCIPLGPACLTKRAVGEDKMVHAGCILTPFPCHTFVEERFRDQNTNNWSANGNTDSPCCYECWCNGPAVGVRLCCFGRC